MRIFILAPPLKPFCGYYTIKIGIAPEICSVAKQHAAWYAESTIPMLQTGGLRLL